MKFAPIYVFVILIFMITCVIGNAKLLEYKVSASGYYDAHESIKPTLVRQNEAGHPECRFTFEVRLHPSNPRQKTQPFTVCIYWGRGGFGAYDLETFVHLYGNGLAQKNTLRFPMRHLGPLTANGHVLSDKESYAFGYISGRDFNGIIHIGSQNYFIESHDKVIDFRFYQNVTERIFTKAHALSLFLEVVPDSSMIFNEAYRVKRGVYDDGDDSTGNDDGDDSDNIPQPPVDNSGQQNAMTQDFTNVNKGYLPFSKYMASTSTTVSNMFASNVDLQMPAPHADIASSSYSATGPVAATLESAKHLDVVEKSANLGNTQNKKSFHTHMKTCRVTLVGDTSFFWAMGRGNEASATGRMLYYVDFVDSFLRSQTWSKDKDAPTETLGLELEKVHLETSHPNYNSKYFTKLVTQLKALPQYINGKFSCLTIAFTAVAIPYELGGINKGTRICAGNKYPHPKDRHSFNDVVLINTVGKDGMELPGWEIIRNLLQEVLMALGGIPDSPQCGNSSLPREKFFSNALRNLSLHKCIHAQVSEALNKKEYTQCLKKQTYGVCNVGHQSSVPENCDCGYRSNCLLADKSCCVLVDMYRSLEKPFRQCPPEHMLSKCREPMGICNSRHSVCRLASNYGNMGEKYAVGFQGMGSDTEDGTSKSEVHFRSVSSVIMAIVWHTMFNSLFLN